MPMHTYIHLTFTFTFSASPPQIPHVEKKMGEKEGFKEVAIEPLRQFAKDSMHLVKKCTKPDRKEFTSIAKAVGVGFSIMGFIGFFVKLVHIPINNILVGG
jgi:protein transport protein SEC61 subunit gamma-like protein